MDDLTLDVLQSIELAIRRVAYALEQNIHSDGDQVCQECHCTIVPPARLNQKVYCPVCSHRVEP